MDARIEETIKNLKRRGFEPYYLESRAQVLPLVQSWCLRAAACPTADRRP